MSSTLDRNALYKRESKLMNLPGYLIVSNSRFTWKEANVLAGTDATRTKILKNVVFSKNLDVYDLCTDDLKKELEAGRKIEANKILEKNLQDDKEFEEYVKKL